LRGEGLPNNKGGDLRLKLKRRDFLKLMGASGAGLVLTDWGFNTKKIEASSKLFKLDSAREYTSVCTFCSCGCGMTCHERNGKLINLEGNSDHIVNEGALCSKGASMAAVPNSDQRVKTPLYRAPGSDKWEEISWDTAIDKIANKIKDTRDSNWIAEEIIKDQTYKVNRTDAIGFLGGAQNNNEECYLFTKMARLLGTYYLEHQARL
jgi:formate dehydrogenase major subunit